MLKNCKNINFNYGFSLLYGNITGNNLYLNDTFILDYSPVFFGDNVVCGKGVKLITSWHQLVNFNIVKAEPISIEINTWFIMDIIVLAGVKIGSNSVIGAGSIVTHSIPDNVLAAGNPCKVIKTIKNV